MNNIELEYLKRDVKKYLKYKDKQLENIGLLPDNKINALKREIERLKRIENPVSTVDTYANNQIKKRVEEIFKKMPELTKKKIIKGKGVGGNIGIPRNQFYINQGAINKIKIDPNRKPKILFISDVKGWAWWIKSHFLKQYLSDEFKIDVKCLLGEGCVPTNRIDQNTYDLYFTYRS